MACINYTTRSEVFVPDMHLATWPVMELPDNFIIQQVKNADYFHSFLADLSAASSLATISGSVIGSVLRLIFLGQR